MPLKDLKVHEAAPPRQNGVATKQWDNNDDVVSVSAAGCRPVKTEDVGQCAQCLPKSGGPLYDEKSPSESSPRGTFRLIKYEHQTA